MSQLDSTPAGAPLPRLQVVPTACLVPHEQFDVSRSQPLISRLKADGALKNPPVVARIAGDDRYVVLDGTNRAVALQALACPHIVVQIVDYDDPNVVLDTWSHLVTGIPTADFLNAVQSVNGLRLAPGDLLHARAELARRQVAAFIVLPPAEPSPSVLLAYVDGDVRRRSSVLTRLVNAYQLSGQVHRVHADHLEPLLPLYRQVGALVVFPHYEPSEIVELARQGAYLPSGVTRHQVPGRALRLNFPLDALMDGRTVEEKNEFLQEWLRGRLADNAVRFYQESTYLFDE